MPKFFIDENIPLQVIEILKNKRFDAQPVPPRMKNSEIAGLATSQDRIVITGDKDFLKLRKDLQAKVKVIIVTIHPRDPEKIIRSVDSHIERCLQALERVKAVELTETGLVTQGSGVRKAN